jgi:hypothetical protein
MTSQGMTPNYITATVKEYRTARRQALELEFACRCGALGVKLTEEGVDLARLIPLWSLELGRSVDQIPAEHMPHDERFMGFIDEVAAEKITQTVVRDRRGPVESFAALARAIARYPADPAVLAKLEPLASLLQEECTS